MRPTAPKGLERALAEGGYAVLGLKGGLRKPTAHPQRLVCTPAVCLSGRRAFWGHGRIPKLYCFGMFMSRCVVCHAVPCTRWKVVNAGHAV